MPYIFLSDFAVVQPSSQTPKSKSDNSSIQRRKTHTFHSPQLPPSQSFHHPFPAASLPPLQALTTPPQIDGYLLYEAKLHFRPHAEHSRNFVGFGWSESFGVDEYWYPDFDSRVGGHEVEWKRRMEHGGREYVAELVEQALVREDSGRVGALTIRGTRGGRDSIIREM